MHILFKVIPLVGALLASSPTTAAPKYEYRASAKGTRVKGNSTPTTPTTPTTPSEPANTPVPALEFQNSSGTVVNSLAFPDTPVGSNSAAQTVTLKNTGAASLTFGTPALEASAPFSLVSTTCSGSLAADATCEATVVFSPQAAQTYADVSYQLIVTSPSLPGQALPLTGTGTMVGVSKVATSKNSLHIFVQKADGTWLAAGNNSLGQLGLGHKNSQSLFVPVPGLDGASDVFTGMGLTFAKWSNGSWKAAGDNSLGQLGLGSMSGTTLFTAVPALTGATQIRLGGLHTFAQLSNGSWAATGFGNYGSLGLGDRVMRTSFTTVPSIAGATEVVVGGNHTFARLANGTWVGTGANGQGQLGIGTNSNLSSFTTIPALAGAVEVLPGHGFTLAKLSNGAWASVGSNYQGELGIGSTVEERNTFTTIPALAGATKVVPGYAAVFARLSNGTWVATGENDDGGLGIGHRTSSMSYVAVPGLAGATDVYPAGGFTYAKLANGALVAAGRNDSGQLGLGTTVGQTQFTLVKP